MSVRGGERFERKAKARAHDRVDKLMRALLLETGGKVVQRTPVQFGTARVNWNMSVGRPDRSTDPEATSVAQPLKDADNRARVANWAAAPGRPAYLTNALPYIGELEKGSSQQAPNGMVRLTIAELEPTTRRMAREIRALGAFA